MNLSNCNRSRVLSRNEPGDVDTEIDTEEEDVAGMDEEDLLIPLGGIEHAWREK